MCLAYRHIVPINYEIIISLAYLHIFHYIPCYRYIVPINCENSGARCLPATYEERANVKTLPEGGTIVVTSADGTPALKDKDIPVEYILAHFGTKVGMSHVSHSHVSHSHMTCPQCLECHMCHIHT